MQKKRKYSKPKISTEKLNPFFLACSSSAANGCSESVWLFGMNPGQAGTSGKSCPC